MKNRKLSRLLATVTLGVVTATGLCVGVSACGHEHEWEWHNENGMHWQECTGCDEKSAQEAHNDVDGNHLCDDCNADLFVKSITINGAATVAVGQTITLTATLTPTYATNKTVTWTSSNTSVATINANGVVTGVATGSVTITATVGNVVQTHTVLVTAAQSNVPVTAVTISGADEVTEGQTITLEATVTPDNATNATVTWDIQPASVATIDQNGVVTGVSAGTAYIVATAGGVSSDVKTITVNASIPATGVTLDNSAATVTVGGTTTITATVAPATASNKKVTWTSSDDTKATVDEYGVVTGVAVGTATITATTEDGNFTASCAVTVDPAPVAVESVTITEGTSGNLAVGETVTLHATVSPSDATNGTVSWSSDNTAVATVNASTGVVTAVTSGTATITATAGGETATYTVTVQTKYDELKSRADNIIAEDFSTYTNGTNLTAEGEYGVKGIFGGTTTNASSDPAKNYVKITNGAAELIDETSGGTALNVSFGQLKGDIEGYFETTLANSGSSWTFVQFQGNSATKNGGEVFGIRTKDGNCVYRLDGTEKTDVLNTISVSDTLYKIYFKYDATAKTITVTMNGKALVTDLQTTITELQGIKFVSSDNGNKTQKVDNIAINGATKSLGEYKADAMQSLAQAYASYDLSLYTHNAADLASAKSAGETAIDGAGTIDEVASALSNAKEAMKAVLADAAIGTAQTAAIDKLKADYPAANYNLENLTGEDAKYNNKAAYAAVIQTAEADILTAYTAEAIAGVIGTATTALADIGSDSVNLAAKIAEAKQELADFITGKAYEAESAEANAAAAEQEVQNGEIEEATTIAEANEKLEAAKSAVEAAVASAGTPLETVKAEAVSAIEGYVAAAKQSVDNDATFVALITATETDAKGKVEAVTEQTRNTLNKIKSDAQDALDFILEKYEVYGTAVAYRNSQAATVYNDGVKDDLDALTFANIVSAADATALTTAADAATEAVDALVASLDNLYIELTISEKEVNYVKYGTKLTLSDLHVSGFKVLNAKIGDVFVTAQPNDSLIIYNDTDVEITETEDIANFVTEVPDYRPVADATELTNVVDNSLYSLEAVGGANKTQSLSVTIDGKTFSGSLLSKNINALYPKVNDKADTEHPNEVHDNSATPFVITVKSRLSSLTIYNALCGSSGTAADRWGTIYCTINGEDKVVKTASSKGDMKNAYTLTNVEAGTVIKLWADNQTDVNGATLHIYGIDATADLEAIEKTVTINWQNQDGTTFATTTHRYFEAITAPTGSPTVNGTFDGWLYDGAALAADLTLPSSDTAYVMTPAVLQSNAFITYKVDGEEDDPKGYTVGETGGVAEANIGKANPKKAGKLFLGWYLITTDGDEPVETKYDFTTLAIDDNIELTAKFMDSNVTITYGTDDSDNYFFLNGKLVDEDNKEVTSLREDPGTGAAGQEFVGWFYTPAGGEETELKVADIVAGTYTVTAKYEDKSANLLDGFTVPSDYLAGDDIFGGTNEAVTVTSSHRALVIQTCNFTLDGETYTRALKIDNNTKAFTITAKKAVTITVYYCEYNGTSLMTNGVTAATTAAAGVTPVDSGVDNVKKATVTLAQGETLTLTASSKRVAIVALLAE